MRIILGCFAIFGIYFLAKGIMFVPLKIVPGTVQYIAAKDIKGYIPGKFIPIIVNEIATYPVVTFRVKESESDTGKVYTTQQEEVNSFKDYSPGTAVRVAYNPAHISDARIYSLTEYWMSFATLVILCVACAVWTAANVFIGRFMKEGR